MRKWRRIRQPGWLNLERPDGSELKRRIQFDATSKSGQRRAPMSPSIVVIGAGPAGLTAAYLLTKEAHDVAVFEADPVSVGGISRTVHYKGFSFDIGGHRFFSKAKAVEDLWTELLPDDILVRPRSSRILYDGKFYSYPLKGLEALYNLGILEATHCVLSYAKARAFPADAKNFEQWVTNQFGSRLFQIFFKTYTEKVWGMPCEEISADWAAQRIKGLSLTTAIKNALLPEKPTSRTDIVKTLLESFRYPRKGPGMLWEACATKIKNQGGTVTLGRRVVKVRREDAVYHVDHVDLDGGDLQSAQASDVISSAPLRELIQSLEPAVPHHVLQAANALKYRDFITVALIMKERNVFDDNWIYIHDPSVKVGRIQNFKSWSPEMVPDPSLACYGLEYFCFEGDGLWDSSDEHLISLAKREMVALGLAKSEDFVDGHVVRQKKAYPVYDDSYQENCNIIRRYLDEHFPGIHLVGRNGMHKYNNQDHAMMTAMLTAQNILRGDRAFDPWLVNQDAEYHEAGTAASSGLRGVPERVQVATKHG